MGSSPKLPGTEKKSHGRLGDTLRYYSMKFLALSYLGLRRSRAMGSSPELPGTENKKIHGFKP